MVCKKSLGFLGFGALANSFNSLRGKNKWTKVTVEMSEGNTRELYIKIDSIKKSIKNSRFDNENVQNLKSNIRSWIFENINEKDTSKIINKNESKHVEKIICDIKNVNCVKQDNISVSELKDLFSFIERNKNQWFKELNDKQMASMYIKSSQEQVRTIRVDADEGIYIILKTTLGEGTFKKARLAIDYNNQKLVANVRAKIDQDKSNLLGVMRELKSPVNHKNVVKQSSILEYESSKKDFSNNKNETVKKLSVIMPFYNEIDMGRLDSLNLNSKQKKDIVTGSLKGLKSIHDQGFIHRDIKPANIFIKSKPSVNGKEKRYAAKVGDFGFLTKPEDIAAHSGTERYAAPEVWREVYKIKDKRLDLAKDGSKLTTASDCYSMGVTIADFLGIPLAFASVKDAPGQKRLILHPMKGAPREGTPEYLVSKLLERNPKKRMTMEEALALAEKTVFY